MKFSIFRKKRTKYCCRQKNNNFKEKEYDKVDYNAEINDVDKCNDMSKVETNYSAHHMRSHEKINLLEKENWKLRK